MSPRSTFAAAFAVCLIAPVHAQAKPKYRNAQDVEAQGPDGRWYRAKVWKVKKGNPPEYELRFEGMPSDARQWLPETKLRDAGAGEVVDPEAIGAVIGAKQLFQQIVAHGRQGKWEDARWNQELDALTERFAAAVASIKQRWPNEPIADLEPLPAKIRANNELRRAELKQKQGAPVVAGAGGQSEGYYRALAQAADGLPFTLSADSVANCTQDLELLAFGTLEARVAKDAEAYPGVFAYYGKEDPATFADLPYGGPKAPQIADADLKRVNQFHLPKIYKAKARLLAAQEALADGVKVLMAKGKTVDDAVAAIRFGEAVKGCQPSNPHVDARLGEARALLAERLKAIAPLMKGPFHREHLRELVAFSSRPTLGSERAEQVVAELTPGKPLYLRGYLTQSVKSLDFKRRDSTLGYETTRIPDLKFRLAGSTAQPWRLPVYSKLSGDALEAVGVVEVDLLPDPATTAYDSHLAYLPALHFARWLLELPDGEHVLELATNGSVTLDADKPGAYGRLKVSMNQGSRAALKAYYDALWAKKLAAVVYPDEFGVTDLKGQIPNADHLAKYGTLLKLTCAETNKVMKPFPNQTQVDNYVGQGFGLFERDGRYEIIALSFSRKPSEAGLRFTALRGLPDDYTLAGPTQFGPTLVEFGYEIPKANLSKTGSW